MSRALIGRLGGVRHAGPGWVRRHALSTAASPFATPLIGTHRRAVHPLPCTLLLRGGSWRTTTFLISYVIIVNWFFFQATASQSTRTQAGSFSRRANARRPSIACSGTHRQPHLRARARANAHERGKRPPHTVTPTATHRRQSWSGSCLDAASRCGAARLSAPASTSHGDISESETGNQLARLSAPASTSHGDDNAISESETGNQLPRLSAPASTSHGDDNAISESETGNQLPRLSAPASTAIARHAIRLGRRRRRRRRRARETGGGAPLPPHRSARVRGDLGLESDSGFTGVMSTGRDYLIRDDGVRSDPMRDWNRVRGFAPRMLPAAQTVCTQSKGPPFPLLRHSGLRPLGLSGGYLSLSESS